VITTDIPTVHRLVPPAWIVTVPDCCARAVCFFCGSKGSRPWVCIIRSCGFVTLPLDVATALAGVTSLQFVLSIGDPPVRRIQRCSRLLWIDTTRRHQPGEIDQQLRISKAGNKQLAFGPESKKFWRCDVYFTAFRLGSIQEVRKSVIPGNCAASSPIKGMPMKLASRTQKSVPSAPGSVLVM